MPREEEFFYHHADADEKAAGAAAAAALAGRRALILGGGPAGLSLALALHQRGCEVQVHERSSLPLTSTSPSPSSEEEESGGGGFGYLLMPNGVAALDALCGKVKQGCLANARQLESAEIFKRDILVEKVAMDGIYCLTRRDLISGMEQLLPEGCVVKGSHAVDIEFEGGKSNENAEQTVVTAVKVVDVASGQGSWLRLRLCHHHRNIINHEEDDEHHNHHDKHNNGGLFDYIFAADGVNSLLAKRLNPHMNRYPGGTTNTIVTCIKDAVLARQLRTRFIKTYFRSKSKRQCCAFGLISPSNGNMLGFLQFSTAFHGRAPYNNVDTKNQKSMHAELYKFIVDALSLPSLPFPSSSSPSSSSPDEPENIRLLRAYLKALSHYDYDYHVWRFVPSGYVDTVHGVNCALLGDAAHPMSDFSSQGLSLAIEDAVSLGNHLVASTTATTTTTMGMDNMERKTESVCSAMQIMTVSDEALFHNTSMQVTGYTTISCLSVMMAEI